MPIWKIKIHKLVISEDFKRIDPHKQETILKVIRKKLTISPQEYGKPLLGELRGYWRLRSGDYRVIYRIEESAIEVLVVKIGIRRDDAVYKELTHRIQRLN